jgi:hypothetical protein
MKKVLKPFLEEDAVYYSDFSGKLIDPLYRASPCEVTLEFNYGSKYDGEKITLHLTDDESEDLLVYLNSKLIQETKNELNKFYGKKKAVM